MLWAEVVNPLLAKANLPTLYEIVPGFIVALLAAWAVSLNDKTPEENVLARFDQACDAFNKAK